MTHHRLNAVANLTSSFSFLIMSLIGFLVNVVGLIVIPMFLWKGQSVGKKLLKIKIVKATGEETENMDILKRYAIPFGLTILGVIPVINILVCCVNPIVAITNLVLLFSDDKKQTLFDKVAETLVVNE